MSSFAGKSTDLASKAKKYMSSPGSVHNEDQNFSNTEQNRTGGNFDSRYGNEERGYSNADHNAAPEYSHPSQGDPYSGQTADTGRGYSSQRANAGSGSGSGQRYGKSEGYGKSQGYDSDLGSGSKADYGGSGQGYAQNTQYGSGQGTDDYGESYGRGGGVGSYGNTGSTVGAYSTGDDYGTGGDSYGSTGDYRGGNYSTSGGGYGSGADTYGSTGGSKGGSYGGAGDYGAGDDSYGSTGGALATTTALVVIMVVAEVQTHTTHLINPLLELAKETTILPVSNADNLGEEGQYGSKADQSAGGSKGEGYNAGKYTTDPTSTSSRAGGADNAGQNLSQSGGQKLDQAGNTTQGGKSAAQGGKSQAQDLGNDVQHHASFASRMKGGVEKMFGKMTRDDELVQKGETMKSGGSRL
ncbi:uncharacterized protein SOCG_00789 [Schizosaccharomyces octosporus yFS286]|uniref:Uncharacterized protein n=1 Tax=Schizosaccharomyces octosporus (strain yFS286) TaxID=483514 RepID=S9PYJ6_SCHOY|nr:uncharacterized protein SOCG_00789 [Schizosaccharomyces octosporus yFS286]EPX73032.1 hypothetical protein SOCG_00789 [Schizosaccharomyces octosporus yFS286]